MAKKYKRQYWGGNPRHTQHDYIESGIDVIGEHLTDIEYTGTETRIGSTSNYTAIESDGTIEFNGEAAVWEDLRFDANAIRAAGVKDPAYSTMLGGLRTYWFSPTTQEELYFNAQMPHAWDGSAIYPHIHWMASTASDGAPASQKALWKMEYAWASIGSTFAAAATVSGSTHYPNEEPAANKHYMTAMTSIVPSTNQSGISSMLICRLYRDSTDAADTFEQGAFLLEVDFHYRINTVGSREETSK